MAIGQTGFLVPGIECLLHLAQVFLAGGVVGDIEPGMLQGEHHIPRQDKTVLPRIAQKPLRALAADLVASRLTEMETKAVADYLSQLP